MGIILVCIKKGFWVRFYPSSITAAFLTQLSVFNNMWEVHKNRRFINDGLTISFIIPIQKSGPTPDMQAKPHWQVVWIIILSGHKPSMFKQNYRWWNSYTHMIVKFYILIFLFHDYHLVFKDSNNYINSLRVYDFCRLPSIIVIRGSKLSNYIPKRHIKLLKYLTKQSKIEDITLNLAKL